MFIYQLTIHVPPLRSASLVDVLYILVLDMLVAAMKYIGRVRSKRPIELAVLTRPLWRFKAVIEYLRYWKVIYDPSVTLTCISMRLCRKLFGSTVG